MSLFLPRFAHIIQVCLLFFCQGCSNGLFFWLTSYFFSRNKHYELSMFSLQWMYNWLLCCSGGWVSGSERGIAVSSERPSIIRHLSAQVCGDWGARHLAPDYQLHNRVSCQTVAMMKPKHHQTTVTPQARIPFFYSFETPWESRITESTTIKNRKWL